MNIGFRTGAIDIGQPVNWSAGLNYGLVSWWMAINQGPYFGSTRFLDLCGRNHGTLTNGPTWGSALGRPGGWGAITCDAAGEGVEVTASAALKLALPITLSCWLRFVGTPDADCGVFGVVHNNTDSNPWHSYCLSVISTGQLRASGNSAGTFVSRPSSTMASAITSWTHVSVRFLSSNVLIYFNGSLDATGAGISDPTYGASALFHAGNYTGISRNSNCQIDSGKIWGRDLGEAGVREEYNTSRTGYQQELNWRRRYTVFDVGGGAAPTVSRARFLPTNWAA